MILPSRWPGSRRVTAIIRRARRESRILGRIVPRMVDPNGRLRPWRGLAGAPPPHAPGGPPYALPVFPPPPPALLRLPRADPAPCLAPGPPVFRGGALLAPARSPAA